MAALVAAFLALLVGMGYVTEDQAREIKSLVPAAGVTTAAVGSAQ